MHLIHRQTCRVCGSTALKPVIDLGEQCLQGAFVKPGCPMPPLRKTPIKLVRCDPTQDERACGLLQMAHSVPPEILYSNYWYRSGTNQTMREHLQTLAYSARKTIALINDAEQEQRLRVLDIGCNDGTLLRQFPKEWERVGVDPSDIAQEVNGQDSIVVYQGTFPGVSMTESEESEKVGKGESERPTFSPSHSPTFIPRTFDIITSIAMFYDLENPVIFAQAIADHLAPNGIWIVEMSYLPKMLEQNSYDTICSEHLEFYSLSVLEWIFTRAQLEVFHVEQSSINGGSIRCHVAHQGRIQRRNPALKKWREELSALRRYEFDLQLDTDRPYLNFQERINVQKEELMALLHSLKSGKKRTHVYGASTKGNTILQWCGIDSRLVECAADRNPHKDGAFTLGTDIPIISEEKSRALKPDYYLVLPWHFREEFIHREQAALKDGTRFIFPLPKLEVVQWNEKMKQVNHNL